MSRKRLKISIGAIFIITTLSITSVIGMTSAKLNIDPYSSDTINGNNVLTQTTIYVDDNNTAGPWDGTIDHPYQYIQDGINAASENDIIYVIAGTYYENILVDKTLQLTGEDKETTIIDGGGTGSVLTFTSDHITISGFTIQNSGSDLPSSGIYVTSEYIEITGNIITNNNNYAIFIDSYNYYNIINNNIVTYNDKGLTFRWSRHNNITNNYISENYEYGILLWERCHHNTISDNVITRTTGTGVYRGRGIYLTYNCYYNKIFRNNITRNNRDGIWLTGSSHYNEIYENNINRNEDRGIQIDDFSMENHIYHNNFRMNGIQARIEGQYSKWYEDYPIGGNYWDNYDSYLEGAIDGRSGPNQTEPGSDGIADRPLNISGYPVNQDRYPLMSPYPPAFLRGDVDFDLEITIDDSVAVLRWLYIPGRPEPRCMDALDVDDNGEVTIGDSIHILRYLYVPGAPPPAAPCPEPGCDPTPDDLTCYYYPCPSC